ncbi:hypothetical protein [Qipengyuania gelatinilytica]|uniref:Uncharacterized protein n=1 Tax=Qipengyuania gelatinilytica TaxID=2867231 RepID=A0ABX9A7E1_9SPHN|nr:hypothetical protein [Qipengyuania gelatinilytica]QZD96229.1 hypothetical protein K3136_05940 [Qipengyuania gelatinilytica]
MAQGDHYAAMDAVLNDFDIRVDLKDHDSGYYIFKLPELETQIEIELGRYLTSQRTKFKTSHAIHTPSQFGPYWTSRPDDDTPDYALRRAIDGIVSYYEGAIEEGHQPSESWLVEG